jgi:hypothetical protein
VSAIAGNEPSDLTEPTPCGFETDDEDGSPIHVMPPVLPRREHVAGPQALPGLTPRAPWSPGSWGPVIVDLGIVHEEPRGALPPVAPRTAWSAGSPLLAAGTLPPPFAREKDFALPAPRVDPEAASAASEDAWFEPSEGCDDLFSIGPRSTRGAWARRVAAAGVAVIGMVLGYVAFRGDQRRPVASAVGARVEPTGAAASMAVPSVSAVRPPGAALPEPKAVAGPRAPGLARVSIASRPAGAIVTLVADGSATVIGRTPLTASIDLTRAYDLVFAVRGRPTLIRHLEAGDPAQVTVELAADAEPGAPASASRASIAPGGDPNRPSIPPAHGHHRSAPPRPLLGSGSGPARAITSPTAIKAGHGALSISSNPPCEIVIDGTPTQLATPQRAISLPAGRHMVTLINARHAINKTFAVRITTRQPTRVVQNFTAK